MVFGHASIGNESNGTRKSSAAAIKRQQPTHGRHAVLIAKVTLQACSYLSVRHGASKKINEKDRVWRKPEISAIFWLSFSQLFPGGSNSLNPKNYRISSCD